MFIKNWKKFQHFKNRKPPWIKLYRDLLDDRDWHILDPKSAKVLVMLWLIASENEGNIPPLTQLAFRLRMSISDTKGCINNLSHWLEQDDINAISIRHQSVSATDISVSATDVSVYQETETETETETEYICPPDGELAVDSKLPDCEHKAVIDLYHQTLPTLRKVEVWNETRKGYLRQRWREVADELAQTKPIQAPDVLEWWDKFFNHVGKSKFLMGKINGRDGRQFTADLEWILKPSNFAKIVEGKYHGS